MVSISHAGAVVQGVILVPKLSARHSEENFHKISVSTRKALLRLPSRTSLTLALSSDGIVHLPPKLIEALIAVSTKVSSACTERRGKTIEKGLRMG